MKTRLRERDVSRAAPGRLVLGSAPWHLTYAPRVVHTDAGREYGLRSPSRGIPSGSGDSCVVGRDFELRSSTGADIILRCDPCRVERRESSGFPPGEEARNDAW